MNENNAENNRKPSEKTRRKRNLSLLLIPVVLTLLVWGLLNHSGDNEPNDGASDRISELKLGLTQNAVDAALGQPSHQKEIDQYLVSVYLREDYTVQIACDSSGTLQAYMITLMHDPETAAALDPKSFPALEGFCLGADSFYDYPGSPAKVRGFVSQGPARSLYAEQYPAPSGENHWLLTMDFGYLGMPVLEFIQMLPLGVEHVDEEVDLSIVTLPQTLEDRRAVAPNTYGCSTKDISMEEMDKLFFFYIAFDSLPLRDLNIQ